MEDDRVKEGALTPTATRVEGPKVEGPERFAEQIRGTCEGLIEHCAGICDEEADESPAGSPARRAAARIRALLPAPPSPPPEAARLLPASLYARAEAAGEPPHGTLSAPEAARGEVEAWLVKALKSPACFPASSDELRTTYAKSILRHVGLPPIDRDLARALVRSGWRGETGSCAEVSDARVDEVVTRTLAEAGRAPR